jgi:hypothetical protein
MQHWQEIPLQRLLREHFDPSDRDAPGCHYLGKLDGEGSWPGASRHTFAAAATG